MARLRLGMFGAILVVLAALTAQSRTGLAGPGFVAWTSGEAFADSAPPPATPVAVVADCWDDPEDGFVPPRQAAAPTRPHPSLPSTKFERADVRLSRPRPRSTGPPGIASLA